jgi:polysaccharide biosynthesis transport protein
MPEYLAPLREIHPPARGGGSGVARGGAGEGDQPSWGLGGAAEAMPPTDTGAIFTAMRRRWRLVAVIATVAVGLAATLAYIEVPTYRAAGSLRLTDSRRALTGNLANMPDGEAVSYTVDPVLSQIQILLSRSVARRAVTDGPGQVLRLRTGGFPLTVLTDVQLGALTPDDTIRLAFDADGVTARGQGGEVRARYGEPIALDGMRFTVREAPEARIGTIVALPTERVVNRLVARLVAKSREGTDVIDVSYTADDPHVAQAAVNLVMAAFRDLSLETGSSLARQRRIFIGEQLKRNDSLLAVARRDLTEFRSREQVYGSKQKFDAEQSGVMALDVRRQELDGERTMFQSLLARLRQPGGKRDDEAFRTLLSSASASSSPVIAQLYTQLTQHQMRRDSLTTGPWASAATNPDVVALDARIRATEEKLVEAVQSHIATLGVRLASLDGMRARSTGTLQQLPRADAEEARLVEQAETRQRLAQQLWEEFQQSQIAEAAQGARVEIVDEAALPFAPAGQHPVRNVALALILGVIVGAGIAYLLEQFSTSIRAREDVERMLQLPGLGIIPAANGASRRSRRPSGRLKPGGGKLVPAGQDRRAGSDANSALTEAFRTLRTNLLFSPVPGGLRRIAVTSPAPQDGKSTVCSNLAVSFAQQGLRVLVIDCDLRRPTLHRVFGIASQPGLTQLLVGETSYEVAIQRTALDGLCILPAGRCPDTPAEMLGSRAMHDVLDRSSRDFDIVLLDTPPVLAATDAAILGTRVDGVLLVVRAGRTNRADGRNAVRQLAAVGAPVIGAVLNDPDRKLSAHDPYTYYSYEPALAEV